MAAKRSTGVVRWFNGQKGYGFITPDAGGEDLFVHQSSIKSDGYRSLADGEKVEFEIEKASDGKTKAVDVTGPGGSSVRGSGGPPRRDSYGGGYAGGDSGYSDSDYNRGGGGGRGNGYGGRSGGSECYNCGQTGHMARDCSNNNGGFRSGGGGGGACYSCGETGHMARDCPQQGSRGGGGGGACYSCGGYGHLARDCSSGGGSGGGRFGGSGGGGGGGNCYSCGEEGHFARDCPNNAN